MEAVVHLHLFVTGVTCSDSEVCLDDLKRGGLHNYNDYRNCHTSFLPIQSFTGENNKALLSAFMSTIR